MCVFPLLFRSYINGVGGRVYATAWVAPNTRKLTTRLRKVNARASSWLRDSVQEDESTLVREWEWEWEWLGLRGREEKWGESKLGLVQRALKELAWRGRMAKRADCGGSACKRVGNIVRERNRNRNNNNNLQRTVELQLAYWRWRQQWLIFLMPAPALKLQTHPVSLAESTQVAPFCSPYSLVWATELCNCEQPAEQASFRRKLREKERQTMNWW